MRIIGITGMFGAGKGTVASYLVERRGFAHYEMSGFITEEVVSRGLPVNRDSMIQVANSLRATFGPTHIVDSLYARALAAQRDAVIESLRALGEARRVHELGGLIIGVDADPRIRYERAIARNSAKDGISFEKFLAQERAEMDGDDPTKQNLRGALAEADIVLVNDGRVACLHAQIEAFLAQNAGEA